VKEKDEGGRMKDEDKPSLSPQRLFKSPKGIETIAGGRSERQ
jgi:hypothetical protein